MDADLENAPRVSSLHDQRKLAIPEPSITRLPTLIDSPALDHVYPRLDELLVALHDEIEERTAQDIRRTDDAVV